MEVGPPTGRLLWSPRWAVTELWWLEDGEKTMKWKDK